MTDLGMMTGKAALRLAKEESGLTRDEIAERLGVSHSVTKRYFNINDTYMPSLEMIPRLCLALGNDILMRWLEARLQGGENFSREEIEEEMVRAANAFEELRTLVNEDPPPSVRDMQHAVNRLILELGCIQEILSGHSLHRNRGALPLCPWWKFWKNNKEKGTPIASLFLRPPLISSVKVGIPLPYEQAYRAGQFDLLHDGRSTLIHGEGCQRFPPK